MSSKQPDDVSPKERACRDGKADSVEESKLLREENHRLRKSGERVIEAFIQHLSHRSNRTVSEAIGRLAEILKQTPPP